MFGSSIRCDVNHFVFKSDSGFAFFDLGFFEFLDHFAIILNFTFSGAESFVNYVNLSWMNGKFGFHSDLI